MLFSHNSSLNLYLEHIFCACRNPTLLTETPACLTIIIINKTACFTVSWGFLYWNRLMSEDLRKNILYRFYGETLQMFYGPIKTFHLSADAAVIQHRLWGRDVTGNTWTREETLFLAFANWADATAVLRATPRAAGSRRGVNNGSTAVTDGVCLSTGVRPEGEKPQTELRGAPDSSEICC